MCQTVSKSQGGFLLILNKGAQGGFPLSMVTETLQKELEGKVPWQILAAGALKSPISRDQTSHKFPKRFLLLLQAIKLVDQMRPPALPCELAVSRVFDYPQRRRCFQESLWLWVKTNGIPFWGIGAPPILEPISVGIGMFTGGTIWILTHGQKPLCRIRRRLFAGAFANALGCTKKNEEY